MYTRDLGEPIDPRGFMLENLEDARAVKAERRSYLRELKAGRYHTDLVIQDPPSCVGTMTLIDFILSFPRSEHWAWDDAIKAVGVSPGTRVRDLARWQRVALSAYIRENHMR
jgi:hypothetical protein